MLARRKIETQELVSRLPTPKHLAAIERRARRKLILVIQIEWDTDRESNPCIPRTGRMPFDRVPRRRLARKIEQRNPIALPWRAFVQGQRLRPTFAQELNIMHIELQSMNGWIGQREAQLNGLLAR